MPLFFFIWPILEARAEIFQRFSFAFWEIWRRRKIASKINWPLSLEIKSEPVKREIRKKQKILRHKRTEERRKNKEKKGKIIRIFWTTEKLDYLSSVSVHFIRQFFLYVNPAFFTKLLLFKEKKYIIKRALKSKLY